MKGTPTAHGPGWPSPAPEMTTATMDDHDPRAAGAAIPRDQSGWSAAASPPDPPDSPGTDAAFSGFYREFIPTLVAFLVWQGARLSDAADIAQDTMIKLYRNWSTIRHREAWARRVASRELVRRFARVPEDPCPDPLECPLLPTPTNVEAWEQRHEVLRLLDQLPPRQRQVLAWTVDGYTPAEIAVELGIAPEAVRSSLLKARRTLARLLGMTGDE